MQSLLAGQAGSAAMSLQPRLAIRVALLQHWQLSPSRWRPDGDNPEQCLHEVMFLLPVPEGEERPAPAPLHFLDLEDDYTEVAEIGSYLAKIFNQDYLNHKAVQKGLHNHPKGETIYASYQETKIRHFHDTLDKWISSETAPKSK